MRRKLLECTADRRKKEGNRGKGTNRKDRGKGDERKERSRRGNSGMKMGDKG